MSTYLITGASGFIGSRLVNLLISKNHKVILLIRKPIKGYDSIIFDFESDKFSELNLSGVDIIIHLAGIAHDLKNINNHKNIYQKINVDSVKRLVETAIEYKVKKFIFVSSVKAGGNELSGIRDINEINQNVPIGLYGKSKQEAELTILNKAISSKIFISIVRPALVYGPGVKGNLALMLKAIKKGWLPPLPRINNSRSMIHVDDLVYALHLVSNDKRAKNEIFIATDGNIYSSRQIYDAMCFSLGKPIPKWALPHFIFKLISFISKKSEVKIEKLFADESYSSEKINALGFSAKRSLNEMNETFF